MYVVYLSPTSLCVAAYQMHNTNREGGKMNEKQTRVVIFVAKFDTANQPYSVQSMA